MRDLIDMWNNTRMVVLTAVTASLYAAILIPFKVLPIIPGVTEFRPANAVPVVCSFLFGPAAAWGSAIGNVIGDFFGGIGPGSLFGFAGNFLYGFLPYKVWEILSAADPVPARHDTWTTYLLDPFWLKFLGVLFLAAGSCALVVGWGLNVLGFVPFAVLGNIVLINNFAVAATLGPLLLSVIYPRVKRSGLLYTSLMPHRHRPSRLREFAGVALILIATAGGLVAGNLLSTGQWSIRFPGLGGALPAADAVNTPLQRMAHTSAGLLPAIVFLTAGIMLL